MNENERFDAGTDNLLAEFDYTVRDDGRRSGAVEKFFDDGGTTPFEQNTFAWTYDDLGRLIGEVLDSSDNTLDYTDTFEWDVVGNRLETSRDWGDVANDDYTTTYQYDANDRLTVETKDHVATSVPDVVTSYSYYHTQQTGKSVVTDGVPTSNQLYEYDLQGRMASVTNQTLDSSGNVVGVQTTEYEYDTAGNRVVATNTVDANNDGTPESVTRTEYLTDANNPTGYSQVIEETEFDDQGNPVKKVVYTIGHDQISQTVYTHDGTNWDSGETHHFGYDGHGSVRVLYDAMAAMVTSATNNVLQLFHFDAHGNLLNMQAVEALTSYLYSGEAFDSNIGQQYLRARWYDATTGRFNRLDPFFGNLSDPQSLHKYLYVHGDPVNGVDPSGLMTLSNLQISFSTISRSLATYFPTFARLGSWVLGNASAWARNFFINWTFATGIGTLITSSSSFLAWFGWSAFSFVSRWAFTFGQGQIINGIIRDSALPALREMEVLAHEIGPVPLLFEGKVIAANDFVNDIASYLRMRVDTAIHRNAVTGPLVFGQIGWPGSLGIGLNTVSIFYEFVYNVNLKLTTLMQHVYSKLPVRIQNEIDKKAGIESPLSEHSIVVTPNVLGIFEKGFNRTLEPSDDIRLIKIILRHVRAGRLETAGADLLGLWERINNKYGEINVERY